MQHVAFGYAPESYRVIPTGACERPPVAAVGDAFDIAGMRLERSDQGTVGYAPDADGLVAAGARQRLAVGAERDRVGLAGVPFENMNGRRGRILPAVGRAPQAYERILGRARDQLAAGAERYPGKRPGLRVERGQ